MISQKQTFYDNIRQEDLIKPVKTLLEWLKTEPFYVILLKGEMGSGKTTFIRSFIGECRGALPFKGSPTFSIHHIYDLKEADFPFCPILSHFDFDRLSDPSELEMIGFDSCLQEKHLIFIENDKNFLKKEQLKTWVEIEFFYTEDDEKRTIKLTLKHEKE